MNFKTHNDLSDINTNMTCLQGYIQAPLKGIVAIFGQPTQDGLKKNNLCWQVQFASGEVATLYSWKRDFAIADDEYYVWHIGGHSRTAVKLVHDAFRQSNQLQARSHFPSVPEKMVTPYISQAHFDRTFPVASVSGALN